MSAAAPVSEVDELPGNVQKQSKDARMLQMLSLDHHDEAAERTGPGGPSQMAAGVVGGMLSGFSSLTGLVHGIADVADVSVGLLIGKEKAVVPAMATVMSEPIHREVCRTLEETSWRKLARTANGCNKDYFARGVDSIRVKWPGPGSGVNLVKTMQVGLTVLHYTGSKFERRCLKVDEQLRFFYVLAPPDQKSPRQPVGSARGASPVTIPLPHVKHTFAMDHAMHICEKNGIAAHELQMDSVFAMLVDARETTGKEKDYDALLETNMPTMDSIQVFICQSENRLSNFIQAAIDLSQGLDSSAGTHQPARVDTIGLVEKELEELLDKGVETIKFDLSFKHEKRMRSISIQSEAVGSDDLGGMTKQLAGELLAVDYSRVVHVIQDAVSLRQNILLQHNEIVKRGIVKFVQDWSDIDQPTSPEVNLGEALEEASSLSRSLQNASDSSVERFYFDSGSRAVLQCMTSMFEVEKAVQDFSKVKDEDSDTERPDVEEQVTELALQELPANVTSTKTAVPARLSDAKWKCPKCGFICLASNEACQVCGTLSTAAAATDGATAPQMVVAATTESTAGIVSPEDHGWDETYIYTTAGRVGAVPPVNLAAVARQEDVFPSPSPAYEKEAAPRNYFNRTDPLTEPPPEPEDKRGSGSVFACAGASCANQERGKDSNGAQEPKDCILQ